MRPPIPTIYILCIILSTLVFSACNTRPIEKERAMLSPSGVITDTLYRLLDSARTTDTLTLEQSIPFLFFQSGHLFNNAEKHAVTVSSPTDSTAQIKLYHLQDHTWQLMDSLDGLPANTIAFHAIYADYNFDTQPDIYIQRSISNGYAMSRGYLLLIDPFTGKISLHMETGDLANMRLDAKTSTVFSEDWQAADGDKSPVRTLHNKWVSGVLKTIDVPAHKDKVP